MSQTPNDTSMPLHSTQKRPAKPTNCTTKVNLHVLIEIILHTFFPAVFRPILHVRIIRISKKNNP